MKSEKNEKKIKLNAAYRLLSAETSPQEEALKRRLETQKEKPKEEQTFSDKRAMIDTKEQLERVKEQTKRQKEAQKPAAERKPATAE